MAVLYNFNDEPIKGAGYTFSTALTSQADVNLIQTSPTLASGDVKVSIDGGNFTNIGTLPTQIESTGILPVILTSDEMNGDRIDILFVDAAGSEWQDQLAVVYTKVAVTVSGLTSDDVLASSDLSASSDIWSYATRTLTQTPASVISSVSGTTITDIRGDDWSIDLTLSQDLTGKEVKFIIKSDYLKQGDSDATILIDSDGLSVVNGEVYTTTTDGSITVTDAGTGAITIVVKSAVTSLLENAHYTYGIQQKTTLTGAILENVKGKFNITADVVRSVT